MLSHLSLMNLATSLGRDTMPELIRPGAGGGLGSPSKPSSRLVVKCKVRLTSCLKSRISYYASTEDPCAAS